MKALSSYCNIVSNSKILKICLYLVLPSLPYPFFLFRNNDSASTMLKALRIQQGILKLVACASAGNRKQDH